ncbi:hypothetical protein ACFV0C_36885 [Streptomyces sp. NPDC059568]|uniref:hypothetical protein n=1 Tax=Streptomyces sp. NPDC059568 TaxID=3346868 RepID=UPI00368017F7
MTDTRKQLLADLIDDLAGERRAPQIAADYLVRHRALVLTEATNTIRALPLDPAVMAMGGMVAQAYRRALNDAAAVLGKQAAPIQERPEATHEGPSPSHGGLTTHRGTRDTCTGPDCGPTSPAAELRQAADNPETQSYLAEMFARHGQKLSNMLSKESGNHGRPTYSAADELRSAANILRALATTATPGIWTAKELPADDQHRHPAHWVTTEHDSGDNTVTSKIVADYPWGQADVTYIATMHPRVGMLLATWLDSAAEDATQIGADHHALALARAINNRPR